MSKKQQNEGTSYQQKVDEALQLIAGLEKSLQLRNIVIGILIVIFVAGAVGSIFMTPAEGDQKEITAEKEATIEQLQQDKDELRSELSSKEGIIEDMQYEINTLKENQETEKEEPIEQEETEEIIHTVKPGESLWDIAQKILGDGYKYRDIAKKNQISNPDLIREGDKLVIKNK